MLSCWRIKRLFTGAYEWWIESDEGRSKVRMSCDSQLKLLIILTIQSVALEDLKKLKSGVCFLDLNCRSVKSGIVEKKLKNFANQFTIQKSRNNLQRIVSIPIWESELGRRRSEHSLLQSSASNGQRTRPREGRKQGRGVGRGATLEKREQLAMQLMHAR